MRLYHLLCEQDDQLGAVNALMDMITLCANRLHSLEDQLDAADDNDKSSAAIMQSIEKAKNIPLNFLVTGLKAGGHDVDQTWVSDTLGKPQYQDLINRIDTKVVRLKTSTPPADSASPDVIDKSAKTVDKMADRQIQNRKKQ